MPYDDSQRVPAGFRETALCTVLITTAAQAEKLTRPPAWAHQPAGHPLNDEAAWWAYRLFAHVPELIGVFLAAFLAGSVIGSAPRTFAAGSVRAFGRMSTETVILLGAAGALLYLGPAGAGTPVIGVLAACAALWPTCRNPHRADSTLLTFCCVAAVAAPVVLIFFDREEILYYSRLYNDDPAVLTAWTSDAWNRHVPWAGDAQAAQAMSSWTSWWNLQKTLLLTELTTKTVGWTGWLGGAGMTLGLINERDGVSAPNPTATVLSGAAALLAGLATIGLEAGNGYIGLGTRAAEATRPLTALLAGFTIVRCVQGIQTPNTPGPGPLQMMFAAILAYSTGIMLLYIVPATSPTPWNSGRYGELTGAETIAAAAAAAATAWITWTLVVAHAQPREDEPQDPPGPHPAG